MKFEPRREVMEILEREIADSDDPNRKVVICGRHEYSRIDIYEEIKKGTHIGREFYNALEANYDEDHPPMPFCEGGRDLAVLYKSIEKLEGIHLGVADKLLLMNYMRETKGDFIGTISAFLNSMGYESVTLTNMLERVRKNEQDCLEAWMEMGSKIT